MIKIFKIIERSKGIEKKNGVKCILQEIYKMESKMLLAMKNRQDGGILRVYVAVSQKNKLPVSPTFLFWRINQSD